MKKNTFQSIVAVLAVVLALGLAGLLNAATAVDLGTTNAFAILAGSTVTNTGSSVITGDLGLSPGTSVTGFPPGTVIGTQHVADATAVQAQTDLTTAYNNAAGQTPVSTVPTELGGTTKTAGIYDSAAGTFSITGTLTLDAQGDPDAVFIFKTASTLITDGSSVVSLINGAQACNVFWQVGSSATLGTNSLFKGNILALTSATLTTGANVEGRVLARNGAVTLDTNVVTAAICVAAPVPAPLPEPEPTPEPTPAPALVPPLISVEKVPAPLALPSGPGSVTYDYTVTNVGTVAMSNIVVADDTCAAVGFVSGDANGDANLDTSETWLYSCTMTLSQTTTNTVTATGEANGFTATDTANATVVVGVALSPPLIHLVKVPKPLVLPAGGGSVTYTYTVTNPGTEPLSDVSVIDDKCTGLPGRVTGHPGDLNKNDLLESNETWTFTCKTKLTASTTNTGTAEGHANGLTALDFSLASVVVTARTSITEAEPPTTTPPSLPSAGLPPDTQHKPWNIALLAGVFALAIAPLIVFRKHKQARR